MTVQAALSSIQQATAIVKAVMTADTKLQAAELKVKLADVMTALAEARIATLDDQEALRSLRVEIEELKRSQDVEKELELRGAVYYRKNSTGESGPYCSRCYATQKVLIPLAHNAPAFVLHGNYKCPNCKAMM